MAIERIAVSSRTSAIQYGADVIRIPDGWKAFRMDPGTVGGIRNGLKVLASITIEDDGQRWLHVSLSREGRLADYDDMLVVKSEWIGDDDLAIQVFPPADKHINVHPYCLHLWCCLSRNPLPDFTGGRRII